MARIDYPMYKIGRFLIARKKKGTKFAIWHLHYIRKDKSGERPLF